MGTLLTHQFGPRDEILMRLIALVAEDDFAPKFALTCVSPVVATELANQTVGSDGVVVAIFKMADILGTMGAITAEEFKGLLAEDESTRRIFKALVPDDDAFVDECIEFLTEVMMMILFIDMAEKVGLPPEILFL